VHTSFLGQLEAVGAWEHLVDACAHAADEAAAIALLERVPLPDAPPPAASALVALAPAAAALPPLAARFAATPRLVAALHAAAGVHAAHGHQPELSLKHHLAVVALHNATASQSPADADAASIATATASAAGASAASAASEADVARASTSWRLAHSLLVHTLMPSERLLSETRRAQLRLLGVSAPSLDVRGEWSGGGGALAAAGGASAAAATAAAATSPLAMLVQAEEAAEGGLLLPATAARVAAAVGA